jgi:predicted anti-sigma-YlaC factor YlaD
MKKLMNILMLSCKKAGELIERKQDEELATVKKLQLKLHLSMCNLCSDYAQKSKSINRLLNSYHSSMPDILKEEKLSEKDKEDIKKKLKL